MSQGIRVFGLVGLVVVGTACAKTKTTKSNSASQAASLTLTSTAYSLQPNGQATITATGGTGIYSSYNTTLGTLQPIGQGQYAFTAPAYSSGTSAAVITVIDSAGVSGSVTIAVTGAQGNSLAMYSTASPIPVGGTVTLSVVGGTGPYSWDITAGGGLLLQTSGQYVGYQAPGVEGSVTVRVSDSAGATLSATIPISGQPLNPCSGAFNINAYGSTGTLTLTPGAGGAITGTLLFDGGGNYTLSGTCANNAITFTLNNGTVYIGQNVGPTAFDPFAYAGTFGPNGRQWVAVPKR